MRTNFDSRIAADAEPSGSAGANTKRALPSDITPLQWSCLHDAAEGKVLAPTRSQQQVWGESEDGAIYHSAHVLRTLHRHGFLERRGRHRYIACEMTLSALKLPVRAAAIGGTAQRAERGR